MWLFDAIKRWWPTATVVCLILYATLMPQPDVPKDVPLFEGADKVVHAGMMGVLAAAAVFDLRRGGNACDLRTMAGVALWVMAFGVLTELAQGALTADRGADPADALADWTGAIVSLIICKLYLNHKKP